MGDGAARFLANLMGVASSITMKLHLACTLLALASLTLNAATLNGLIVGVTDGDTVTLLDKAQVQHKIRLAGIDAPEKKQAFGMRSKENLSDLVFNRQVTVETGKTDRYGREVGVVFVSGKDANLEQVRQGLAWHYKAYQKEQSETDKALYAHAEVEARAAKRGLWRDAEPVPPWEFRHIEKP